MDTIDKRIISEVVPRNIEANIIRNAYIVIKTSCLRIAGEYIGCVYGKKRGDLIYFIKEKLGFEQC